MSTYQGLSGHTRKNYNKQLQIKIKQNEIVKNVRGKGGEINLPSNDMRFGREESERRVFVLRSDLVISELLNEF